MTIAHDLHMARLRIARLEEALGGLVNAKALSGVRKLVAGWNGEDRPVPYDPHPPRLKVSIETNAGAIYALDKALTDARAALTPPASCPRPAPDPCEASEARPEPKA
jgi:hypothetical protein